MNGRKMNAAMACNTIEILACIHDPISRESAIATL
jgi:hypothetical protein